MVKGFLSFACIWSLLYLIYILLRGMVKYTNPQQKINLLKGLLLTGFLATLASVVLFLIVQIF